jgi:hypothetical protein
VLEQIRRENWIEAGRLIREGWERRTIRKSDMVTLFKKLLRKPGEDSLMQASLVMMAKGGITTPEILDLGFAYLQENPRNGCYTGMITDFLQGKNQDSAPIRSINAPRPVDLETERQNDPHYLERLFEAFNQRGLDRYWRGDPESMENPIVGYDASVPPRLQLPEKIRSWNEWEYELWPDKSADWPIAKMFFALKPFDRISAILASPLDSSASAARSMHYLMLVHLWQNLYELSGPALDDLLRGVGILFQNTEGKPGQALLHDRATLVFQKYWTRQINSSKGGRPVPQELSKMAAEVFHGLCAVSAAFNCPPAKRFPAVFPALHQGLDAAHLESIWRFDADAWQRFQKYA